MATGYITTTNQANIIPEIWEKKIFDELYTRFIMREVFETIFIDAGHDTEHYPVVPKLAAEQITQGTPLVGKYVTPTNIDLVIDQNYGVPMTFAKRMLTQNMFTDSIKAIYQRRAGEALNYQLETTLLSFYSSMSQEIVGANLTADNLLYGKQLLYQAGVPQDDVVTLICTPYQYRKLLQFANISDASAFGNAAPVQKGKVEEYYGIKIKVSGNVSVNSAYYNNMLVHKEYAMVGIQQDVSFDVDDKIQPLLQAMNAVASILYGSVEARDGFAVRMPTSN